MKIRFLNIFSKSFNEFLKYHKYLFIYFILFSNLFSQSFDDLNVQKLLMLKKEIGINDSSAFDQRAFNLLSKKLDSLGKKDDQLIDGYEWGGGQKGFEAYINNNIDSLLMEFKREIPKIDTLLSFVEFDSSKIVNDIKPNTISLKPVKDLNVKMSQKKEAEIIKNQSTKKTALTGLRISGNLGKALSTGTSLSNHSSYVESSFFIRFPYGINIGSFLTSIGYETAKYSFESSIDTVGSYYGSGSGPLLNINISKIIKIGGEKVVKEFVVGTQSYNHGSGFVAGYNLNLKLGKLPYSFSFSSRFNTITFEGSGNGTFWASLSAGIGLDL